MKRWLTLRIIGTGIGDDEIRPDLRGVAGIMGYAAVAYSGGEVLVLVVRDQPALDALRDRPGVRHHGDEPLPAPARVAVVTEARRLGAGQDWRPEGYALAEQ